MIIADPKAPQVYYNPLEMLLQRCRILIGGGKPVSTVADSENATTMINDMMNKLLMVGHNGVIKWTQ
jgi:hypothetical protein